MKVENPCISFASKLYWQFFGSTDVCEISGTGKRSNDLGNILKEKQNGIFNKQNTWYSLTTTTHHYPISFAFSRLPLWKKKHQKYQKDTSLVKSNSGWDHLRWAKTGDDPDDGTHIGAA